MQVVEFWGIFIPMSKLIGRREKLEIKGKVIDLIAQGLPLLTIQERVGVNRNTIYNWIAKDERFKKAIDKAKERYAKGQIENKLWQLANGYHEEEVVEEYMGEKLVNGELRPCKYTKKVKVRAPSEKALMALASKYSPKEYSGDNETTINVKITQRDRSLTTEERLKLLEDEGKETIELNDYKELTTSDAVD